MSIARTAFSTAQTEQLNAEEALQAAESKQKLYKGWAQKVVAANNSNSGIWLSDMVNPESTGYQYYIQKLKIADAEKETFGEFLKDFYAEIVAQGVTNPDQAVSNLTTQITNGQKTLNNAQTEAVKIANINLVSANAVVIAAQQTEADAQTRLAKNRLPLLKLKQLMKALKNSFHLMKLKFKQ